MEQPKINFIDYFAEVKDPRKKQTKNKLYELR